MKRAVVALVLACASVARAAGPNADACVDADTSGQTLRMKGKLHEALYDLHVCAAVSCPAVVRADCSRRIDEIEHAMPSVVVSAIGPSANVTTVTMDDAPIATNAPVDVNPGEHRFVFHASGFDPVVRIVVVREGEKSRSVAVSFAANAEPTHETHGSPLRPIGIVIGAVGLASIALGSAFGVATFSAWSSVKNECASASACDVAKASSDRSSAYGFATASDVAFVAGGAFLATGIVLFVLAPRERERVARVAPMFDPHMLGLTLGGEF
jgi:hypothetical protein